MTAQSDRIKKLLDDKDLNEAFESVINAIHTGWANTPPTDADMQAEWHRRLFTLNSVKENLRAAMENDQYEDYLEAEKEKPATLGDILTWPKKN